MWYSGAMTQDPNAAEGGDDTSDEHEEVLLDAYDLDGDGEISPIEEARGQLGLVDARLEEIAEEGGIKGKLADAAHQIVDKLDND